MQTVQWPPPQSSATAVTPWAEGDWEEPWKESGEG